MIDKTNLVLISGTYDWDIKLTKEIYDNLLKIYKLKDIEYLIPKTKSNLSDHEKKNIDSNRPLIFDFFSDREPRTEIGKTTLESKIKGKQIVLIKYMYTPNGPSPNDHHMQLRGFVEDNIKKIDIKKFTLATPYFPFIRSHSVDKYEKQGVYQMNSLKMVLGDLKRAGVDEIITIDPHSDKFGTYCKDLGIGPHFRTPFDTTRYVNWSQLGFNTREEAKKVLKHLETFITYYNENKPNYKNLKIIPPDDGREDISFRFAIDIGLDIPDIGYILKVRLDEGVTEIKGFKTFSLFKEENIREDHVFVIDDDMISGGSTGDDIAKYLKDNGAKKVELWTTHPVCPNPEKIAELKYLDQIVALDTVPNNIEKIKYIKSTSHILASHIYKSYKRGMEKLD